MLRKFLDWFKGFFVQSTAEISDANLMIGSEQFDKARRNFLWFSSFAILLSLVDPVPSDHLIAPPLFGNGLKIHLGGLMFAIICSILYSGAQLIHQARRIKFMNSGQARKFTHREDNVEKALNSTLEQLNNILNNIRSVDEEFSQQISVKESEGYSIAYPRLKKRFEPLEEAFRKDLSTALSERTNTIISIVKTRMSGSVEFPHEVNSQLTRLDNNDDMTPYKILTEMDSLMSELRTELIYSREYGRKIDEIIAKVVTQMDLIEVIATGFQKLSHQIRSADRWKYWVLDLIVPIFIGMIGITLVTVFGYETMSKFLTSFWDKL